MPDGGSDGLTIDLNADVGESSSTGSAEIDERLFGIITSANVACGFHAGDPIVMRRTVRMAVTAGVAIGAHPGFPDIEGFGRREMNIGPREVTDLVLYQLGALSAITKAEEGALRHVKPHGALYNMSVRREDIAQAIAHAIAAFDDELLLVGLPGSALLAAGSRIGLRVAAEGFADRAYEPDGTLTPRLLDGALVADAALAAERAVRMVRDGNVVARDGSTLALKIDTLCVHGDTPGAPALAAAVRAALEQAGVGVRAMADW